MQAAACIHDANRYPKKPVKKTVFSCVGVINVMFNTPLPSVAGMFMRILWEDVTVNPVFSPTDFFREDIQL